MGGAEQNLACFKAVINITRVLKGAGIKGSSVYWP